MLTRYEDPQWVEEVYYKLEYTDKYGNGYSFDCDEQGNLTTTNPAALENYERCRNNHSDFERSGVVTQYKNHFKQPAIGMCECGETFELVNEYMGACECPGCGRWYNLFGQELNPPDQWGDF